MLRNIIFSLLITSSCIFTCHSLEAVKDTSKSELDTSSKSTSRKRVTEPFSFNTWVPQSPMKRGSYIHRYWEQRVENNPNLRLDGTDLFFREESHN